MLRRLVGDKLNVVSTSMGALFGSSYYSFFRLIGALFLSLMNDFDFQRGLICF